MGGKGIVVVLGVGGGRIFTLGGLFPFVGEFNIVVCEGGFDSVYFNMCGCYSL